MEPLSDKIHVAIKSWKRAGKVTTADVMPFAFIWVPDSQAAEYERHYPGKVLAIPDAEDGNLCRKSNAILNRSPKPWTLIMDDDVTSIHRFEDRKDSELSPSEIAELITRGFELAAAVGVKLWGINQNSDEMAFKPCAPFALLSPILGPFNGHLEPELRYDETVGGKDDYDFWLQNIRKHRRTLRINKYHYLHDHGSKPGGFVSMRTMENERSAVKRMEQKWGTDVFRVGGSPGANRRRDINPNGNILNSRVTVPLAGC
jgi:hypothetical protein